ncbi:MAG: diguanylate cyclase [Oscillospiraceae bacterium]|nr:diguanylate cyclase [Oscillospiraceae bacterium]
MTLMTFVVSLTLFISSLVTMAVFMLAIIKCDSKKHLYFLPMILCVLLFVLGYLFEINSPTDESVLVSHMLMYCGASFVVPLYLLFILDITNIKIRRWQIIAIIGQAVVLFIFMVSSPYQNLYFKEYFLSDNPHLKSFDFIPGVLYMPLHYIQYGLGFLAILLLLRNFLRTDTFAKRRAFLLLISGLLPLIANILFALRLKLFNGLNMTPVSMVLVVIVLYVTITRYKLFDLIPFASKQAIQSMKDALIVLDYNKYIIDTNPSAVEIFPQIKRRGESIDAADNLPLELIRALDESEEHLQNIEFSLEEENLRHYNANITRISDKGRLYGWLILIYDITDTVNLLIELEHHATFDTLTGIHNRRYFIEYVTIRLHEAERLKQCAAVILFDIDKFKDVNDTYGHAAGDEVLSSIAKLISAQMRPYDLFARYGGEEFILFLPDTNKRLAIEIAERIRTSAENHVIQYESVSITRTLSIGLAVSSNGTDKLETLIEIADAALYRAKEGGRNRVEFS